MTFKTNSVELDQLPLLLQFINKSNLERRTPSHNLVLTEFKIVKIN